MSASTYDLLVVGGTPAGVAAAVTAARAGLRVLLTQFNRHIGGMMTNGLMQWDAHYAGLRAPFFSEVLARIAEYYRVTDGEASRNYQLASYSKGKYPLGVVEPKVAEGIFLALVTAEPTLTLAFDEHPSAARVAERLIVAVTLRHCATGATREVSADAFVDATYEGDLLALAGAPYRVGREGRDEYGEPHAGQIFTSLLRQRAPAEPLQGLLALDPIARNHHPVLVVRDPEAHPVSGQAVALHGDARVRAELAADFLGKNARADTVRIEEHDLVAGVRWIDADSFAVRELDQEITAALRRGAQQGGVR